MTRFTAKVRRVHRDGSTCTHKIGPNGRNLDRTCPGVAGYEATCSCGHPFERQALRVVLDELRSTHMGLHSRGAIPAKSPAAQSATRPTEPAAPVAVHTATGTEASPTTASAGEVIGQ